MILRSSYYMLRRMLRNYIGMIILVATPLALITLLGFMAGGAASDKTGLLYKAEISVTMVFTFQLFGGFLTMEYVRSDLMSASKWRMYALPAPVHHHALSVLLTSTLFNVLQGFVLVLYAQWVLGVDWGNLGLVAIALLVVSALSQLVFINLVLGVTRYKTAERAGTAFGIISVLLAETWFPLPEASFFQFLATYGNPLSLGQNLIYGIMADNYRQQGLISLAILLASSVALTLIATWLGRRKLL